MSGFTHTTVDKIITTRPCLLFSVTLTATGAGVADVSIYEGQDASSGRLVVTLKVAASSTVQTRFNGLVAERGLYVDVGSNVASLTVEYEVTRFRVGNQEGA